MRPDLRTLLAEEIRGLTCVVGLGNPDWGDDGFGVALAEALKGAGLAHVVVAGTVPESVIGRLKRGNYQNVLLVDAVDFAGEPGSVVFLDAAQLRSRFPQFSTHKLSLGTVASLISHDEGPKVWCLGAKPVSLAPSAGLSERLETVKESLKGLLLEVLGHVNQGPERREEGEAGST